MEGSSGCVGFNVWLRMGWVYSDKVTAGADTLPPPLHRRHPISYQPAGARVPATQAPKQRPEASLYSSSSSEEGRGERASPAEAPEAEEQEKERHLVSFSIEWVGEPD